MLKFRCSDVTSCGFWGSKRLEIKLGFIREGGGGGGAEISPPPRISKSYTSLFRGQYKIPVLKSLKTSFPLRSLSYGTTPDVLAEALVAVSPF